MKVLYIERLQIQMENKRIGFLGAGQMAEALARGFVNKGVVVAENIRATDPMEGRKEVFRSFGAVALNTNVEVRRCAASCIRHLLRSTKRSNI